MIVICPECGKKTAIDNNVCEQCGCKIKQCAECGNVLKDDATVCDYCGLDLQSAQEIKQTEKEDEYLKAVNKQAEEMIKESAQKFKNWKWLSFGSTILFAIFFAIGFFKLSKLAVTNAPNYWQLIANIDKELKTVKIMTVLVSLTIAIDFFFIEPSILFSKLNLSKKIKEKKFDCYTYCDNIIVIDKNSNNVGKTGNVLNFADKTTNRFVCGCMYAIDPTKKTLPIVLTIINAFFGFMFFIFASIGLSANVESYVSTILLTGSTKAFSFQFNTQLIIACVFLVLHWVLDIIVDIDNPEKWLKEYQSKK